MKKSCPTVAVLLVCLACSLAQGAEDVFASEQFQIVANIEKRGGTVFRRAPPGTLMQFSSSETVGVTVDQFAKKRPIIDAHLPDNCSDLFVALGKFSELEGIHTTTFSDRSGLRKVSITNDALRKIKPLPKLRVLDLSDSQITDEGLQYLSKFPSLEYLYLNDTRITNAGLVHLQGLKNLITIGLNGTEITDAGGLKALEGVNLKFLCLRKTNITDAALEHVQKLPHLIGLDLTDSHRISDKGLYQLRSLASLTHLELDGTNVSDDGLAHLSRLTNLERLTLTKTKINGDGLEHLAGLTQLWDLDLCDTHIANKRHVRFTA